MNAFAEVYDALCDTVRGGANVRKLADTAAGEKHPENEATNRRMTEDGFGIVRLDVVPMPGGTWKQISSSSTEIEEHFYIETCAAFLSHRDCMALEYEILAALWGNRTMGLSWVVTTRIDKTERAYALGVPAQGKRGVTWTGRIEITVTMILDRTHLPMG